MPLNLPSFRDRQCEEIGFCAYLDGEGIPDALSEIDEPIFARYLADNRENYVTLVPPFMGEDQHVHLHLSAGKEAEDFKHDVDLDRILELLRPIMGRTLKVNIRGTFRVKKEDVPSFIRAVDLPQFSGNVGVKLIGGKVALQSAPIHTLAWELSPKGNAKIYLEARQDMTLSDNYLIEGLDFLEDTFKVFFSKEASNV